MLVLCGVQGSGKTTTAKILEDEFFFDRIISYTTRPQRDGEEDAVDYFFENDVDWKLHKFDDWGFLVETEYHTANGVWRYGTLKDDILEADDSTVMVANTDEVKVLIKDDYHPNDIVIIQLDIDIETQLDRLKDRDPVEVERRRKAEDKDFAEIAGFVTKINVSATDSAYDIAKKINDFYKKELGLC